MKLVEFVNADPPHGPVFINPEQVVAVSSRFESNKYPPTETTVGFVGDDDAFTNVIGTVEEVASRLAVTISKVDHPERVNDGTEDLGS